MALIYLVLGLFLSSSAQEAPDILCVSVEVNDVRISWNQVSDPATNFTEYKVYRYNTLSNVSSLLGIYGSITTVEHIQLGTLAANESILYYVTSAYGGDIFYSDTVPTVHMNLASIVDFSVARITWGQFIYASYLGEFLYYVIQMNHDGTWQDLDTLYFEDLTLQYNATLMDSMAVYSYAIQVCQGAAPSIPISFRLQLHHSSGCISQSSTQTNQFKDATAPTPPIIETVSVDTLNNQAHVYWYPSPEEDTGGYRVLSDFEIPWATTNDPSILDYQNPLSLAGQQIEGFLIVAEDTCGNRSATDQQIPHFTILPQLEFIKCSRSIRISWNKYIEWPGGVKNYVVYGGITGTALNVLDTVSNTATAFVMQNAEVLTSYSFFVKALPADNRRPSFSAKKTVFTNYPDLPDFTYLANVSTLDKSSIELKALVDPAAVGTRYRFQKLDRFGEEFDALITVGQAAADVNGIITVVDNASPNLTIYTYRLAIVDSCGFEDSYSFESSNILLTLSTNSDSRTNTITWTPYHTWAGIIGSYRIFRSETGVFPFFPYATVAGDRTYFIDDVSSESDYQDHSQYCYRVQAMETNNSFGVDQRSLSNTACAVQENIMFIPNAMVIGGENGGFKPIGGYFDKGRYIMQIFDRWGQVMFETNDYETSWDGKENGRSVPEGVYAYRIRFFSGDGKEFNRNGTLTVLYAP
jgi:gliding motility-associated-like protein